jgi:ribosome-binding protein aMBF1 (putative translation factor)
VITEKQPINARVQAELVTFLEVYRNKHKLSRTDALEEAIRALRQREREQELREGYKQFARDARKEKDVWLDSDLAETLEAIEHGKA